MAHALVTGASRGIGACLAHALGAAGYDVTLVARGEAELLRVADGLPAGARRQCLTCDLADTGSVSSVVERAQRLGPVDVLVNNAGMEIVTPTVRFEPSLMEAMVALNFRTPTQLIRRLLPGMVDRGFGSIVDVCSVAGSVHPPFQSLYSATKAALAAHNRSLRAEVARTGVHVMAVYPGPIRTELGLRAAAGTTAPAHLVPWGTPEVLAQRVLKGIERRSSSVVYPRFYWLAMLFPIVSQRLTDAQRARFVDRDAPLDRR